MCLIFDKKMVQCIYMIKRKKIALILALVLVVPVFVASQVSFWQDMTKRVNAADPVLTQAQIDAQAVQDAQDAKDKEAKKLLEDKQDSLLSKIEKEEKAKAKLQQNLGQIQGAVYSTQKTINNAKSSIAETAENISRKEAEVKNLSDKIELQKSMLRALLQQVYYNQSQPILNVVLTKASFADVFSDTDNLLTIEDKIKNLSFEVSKTKSQMEDDKQQLALEKEKHEEILADKVDEKQGLVATQIGVQSDIQEKEATISELQAKLAELQSDLNVLTGKSFNASDINEAISYASKKQGVPKGVLYGFLKRETNLGANTGQCTYADVERVSIAGYKKYGSKYKNSIALLYKRKGLFEGIIKDLKLSKNTKISCTISFASAGPNQGGAMGVAQFMSDIWLAYESRIASATGHAKPDPWNLTDGVMALAIKVRAAGATSSSSSGIRSAVTSYYGIFSQGYYDTVYYWAKNYDKLFN